MTQQARDPDLPFRSDFTARVMGEAGAILKRRRRTQSVMVATLVAIAVISAWRMWPANAPDMRRVPQELASNDVIGVPDFQTAQPSLLNFVFPEAAALLQFSDQYGESGSDDAMENDAVFFPDAEDAEVDNS